MSPLTPVSLNRANKTNSGYKYDPGLAKAVGKKLLGEYYTEENLENWNNSEITLFRSVLTGTIPSMYIKRFKTIYVFNWISSECWRLFSQLIGVPLAKE